MIGRYVFSIVAGVVVTFTLLFLMQLHGFSHTTYSDEFPLNKDDHYHTHKEMDAAQKPSALEGYKKKIQIKPEVHSHGDGEAHSH